MKTATDAGSTHVAKTRSSFTQQNGGMIGTSHKAKLICGTAARKDVDEECEVLFVGVVDALVPFKFKKKAEYMTKSVIQHGQNFSVIPPCVQHC